MNEQEAADTAEANLMQWMRGRPSKYTREIEAPAGLANAGHLAGGGPSGSDTIPAWLSPGEFVMRKEAVDHIGLMNLAMMNARGYDTGGIVGATSIPSGPNQRASQTIQASNKITLVMQGSASASDHENAKA
jgi:hypothetical protein